MEWKDWAIIWATLISPAIAVTVTLVWQKWQTKRDAKERLFILLMANRQNRIYTAEVVGAFNTIEVIFSDTPKVLEAWKKFYDLTEREIGQAANHAYLRLLSEMSRALGYKNLEQTDIDKYYYPQGHANFVMLDIEAKQEIVKLLKAFSEKMGGIIPNFQNPGVPPQHPPAVPPFSKIDDQ